MANISKKKHPDDPDFRTLKIGFKTVQSLRTKVLTKYLIYGTFFLVTSVLDEDLKTRKSGGK